MPRMYDKNRKIRKTHWGTVEKAMLEKWDFIKQWEGQKENYYIKKIGNLIQVKYKNEKWDWKVEWNLWEKEIKLISWKFNLRRFFIILYTKIIKKKDNEETQIIRERGMQRKLLPR